METSPTQNASVTDYISPRIGKQLENRDCGGRAPALPWRRELVNLIDPAKAIAYFQATQGWSEEEVRQQVLTPIEEASLLGTPHADQNSIMCYQIPGSITKSGKPIIGGLDIDPSDYAFIAKVYPKLGKGLGAARKKATVRRHRSGRRRS